MKIWKISKFWKIQNLTKIIQNLTKFKIWQNLKISLTLTIQIWILTTKISKFDQNLTKSTKISKFDQIFWKIQNLTNCQNLIKNWPKSKSETVILVKLPFSIQPIFQKNSKSIPTWLDERDKIFSKFWCRFAEKLVKSAAKLLKSPQFWWKKFF